MALNKTYETLIFIGNGYDIAWGHKTSYKDFAQSAIFENLKKKGNKLVNFIYDKLKANDHKWVDIEVELGNYSRFLSEKKDKGENEKPWQETCDDFKAEHKELSTSLKDYLKNHKGEGILPSKLNDLVRTWEEDYGTENMCVISFNYTGVCGGFFTPAGTHVEYIHGCLENSDIAIGVDENCQIVPEHSFIYKSHNPNTKIKGVLNVIKNAQRIIIYGCSIGETDDLYFKQVFNNVSGKTFDIYYHGNENEEYIKNRVHAVSGSMANLKNSNEVNFLDSSTLTEPPERIKIDSKTPTSDTKNKNSSTTKSNEKAGKKQSLLLPSSIISSGILILFGFWFERAMNGFVSLAWFFMINGIFWIILVSLVFLRKKFPIFEYPSKMITSWLDSLLQKSSPLIVPILYFSYFCIFLILVLPILIFVLFLILPPKPDAIFISSITIMAIFLTIFFNKIKRIIAFFFPVFIALNDKTDSIKEAVDYIFKRDVFRLIIYCTYFVYLTYSTVNCLFFDKFCGADIYLEAFVVYLAFDSIYQSKENFSFSWSELSKRIVAAARPENEA